MGPRSLAVIHCAPHIAWQARRARYFAEGFRRRGIPVTVTDSRTRLDSGTPVLLGTTLWRAIEATGEFLLVDRCSFGDTDAFVSLVWNGHGRRGDHKVPDGAPASRWECIGVPLQSPQAGSRAVLCGQTETYSPHWDSLAAWYASVRGATHFRPHPAGDNPTPLPTVREWQDCGRVVTLNSSVAVQTVLAGIPTETHDEGAMAWDVCRGGMDRRSWCHWLAWTQWADDEIREGTPWDFHW